MLSPYTLPNPHARHSPPQKGERKQTRAYTPRCAVTVGTSTNPQKVDVLLDTGSFELWVNPDCAKSNVADFCKAFGQYDPTKSSTSKDLAQGFSIQSARAVPRELTIQTTSSFLVCLLYFHCVVGSEADGKTDHGRQDHLLMMAILLLVCVGANITGQQFGVANTSDLVWFGIMGLARGKGNGFLSYNTVLDSVVAQGLANSRLFSLDLGA